MPTTDELKSRKIVQWALAYLAGAWVVLQVVDILGEQFGWPTGLVRGITVALTAGFFVTLVLAWYHGEQGRQRVSGPELLMVAALLLIAGAAVSIVGGDDDVLLASQDIPAAPRDVLVGPLLDAQVAAVRGDAESAAASLRRATELGWRGPRWIRSSPIYDRVRADSAFAAALAEQERLVARERREVERMRDEAN